MSAPDHPRTPADRAQDTADAILGTLEMLHTLVLPAAGVAWLIWRGIRA